MNDTAYHTELSRCVRCGACKTLCPTFLSTLNETMGARGRVALLGELEGNRLPATKRLADKIFSCMLCGACKGSCPTGIDIPEMIYQGRTRLKDSFSKGHLLKKALQFSASRIDSAFSLLRILQRFSPVPLAFKGLLPLPEIAPEPFKNSVHVYNKRRKKTTRIAVFAGCSVNYFHPELGKSLSRILFGKGYEVVVFKGETCCGAPFRAAGLEAEAVSLAKRNLEYFNKVRAEAIVSMCPTCTTTIRDQYPSLAGSTISNLMDVNEFILKYDLAGDLAIPPGVFTYHDPCHLSYGLGIRNEPRRILKGISGVELVEMHHPADCCGFAGLFSCYFKDIAQDIGRKKIENIADTKAGTVVTSCPGCIMQLEHLSRQAGLNVKVRHIVEIIDEAMHGQHL